jgi:hypothetical protein
MIFYRSGGERNSLVRGWSTAEGCKAERGEKSKRTEDVMYIQNYI